MRGVFLLVAILSTLLQVVLCGQIRGVAPNQEHLYQSATIKCDHGIIALSRVNDNFCDCPATAIDEPGTNACPDGKFYCLNRGFKGIYIPSSMVNDGVCDCCSGEDEWATNKCQNTCRQQGVEQLQAIKHEIEQYKLGLKNQESGVAKALEKLNRKRADLEQIKQSIAEKLAALNELREKKTGLKEENEEATPLLDNKGANNVDDEDDDEVEPPPDEVIEMAEKNEAEEELEKAKKEAERNQKIADFTGKYGKTPQQINDEFKELERQITTAERDLRNDERERDDTQNLLDTDFGPNNIFFALYQDLVTLQTAEYTYTLSPFDFVKQGQYDLGKWKGWRQKGIYDVMEYTEGAACWQGPRRSTAVHLKCGAENRLSNVQEPAKCVYSVTLHTPYACDKETLQSMESSLRFMEPDSLNTGDIL